MKKWNEYTRQEKWMIFVVVVLFAAVLLSWGRVHQDFKKGMHAFFGTPQDSLETGR